MAATLTISRAPLSLGDLVIPRITSGVYAELFLSQDPPFSPGQIKWRKTYATNSPDVVGEVMTQAVLDTMTSTGGIYCNAEDPANATPAYLQTLIAEVIKALTQRDPTTGSFATATGFFEPFTMTYTHGTTSSANYSWTCTEPADIEIGSAGGALADTEMAELIQLVPFSIVRNPIPLSGPI